MIRISQRQPRIVSNAIILDDYSKSALKAAWAGKHSKYSGDHVTLDYGKNEYHEDFGKRVPITVLGYACDDKAEAILVSCGGVRCDNANPHITISTAPGVPPVYSNELLSRGPISDMLPKSLSLHGIVGSFINGKYVTQKHSFKGDE